jgi:Peptidase MA superfamily
MRRVFSALVGLGMLLAFVGQARAQSAIEVTDLSVSYFFGEQITFSARIASQSPIQEAYLFFIAEGDQNTRVIPVQPDTDGWVKYQHLIKDGTVRPFAWVEYWLQVTTTNGQTGSSKHDRFRYEDNRYPWQIIEDEQLRVHWYAGDTAFGQAAFDAAHAGLQKMSNYLGMEPGGLIEVYVYASAADVQDALSLGGFSWVGGYANPDLGVVLVGIEPGENQALEMARQIPHELAHILLYRMTGASYLNLPTWLVEGIASQAEQATNPDYVQVLALAKENDTLLPIASLCGPFPMDVSSAILAYAESESFVRYLHTTYGTSGLQQLIRAYADGLGCEQGSQTSLGLPVSQLDLHWQQVVLGKDIPRVALQNLLPYFAILGLMLVIPIWHIRRKK